MIKDESIYLVTGATGFIGNNIVRALVDAGKRVRCFVRNRAKAETILSDLPVEYAVGDVSDADSFRLAIDKDRPVIVIHAAGVVTIGKRMKRELTQANVIGTRNVTDISITCGVKRLIYISSVHAIDEPKKGTPVTEAINFDLKRIKGDYAKSKAASTAYVYEAAKTRGLDAVILHPSGVIGPHDYGASYLTKMVVDYARHKLPAGVKGGYNFVDVRDVATATLAAIEHGQSGACYLVTGHYVSVKEIFNELHTLLGGKQVKLMLPLWVARAALPFLTMYATVRRIEPLYNGYSLYTLGSNSDFRCDRAKAELGYQPRPFKQTVRDTVAFLKTCRPELLEQTSRQRKQCAD